MTASSAICGQAGSELGSETGYSYTGAPQSGPSCISDLRYARRYFVFRLYFHTPPTYTGPRAPAHGAPGAEREGGRPHDGSPSAPGSQRALRSTSRRRARRGSSWRAPRPGGCTARPRVLAFRHPHDLARARVFAQRVAYCTPSYVLVESEPYRPIDDQKLHRHRTRASALV